MMPSIINPRQVDFKLVKEDTGQTLLSDNALVETRLVLADLFIMNEDDVFGAQVAASHVIALRIKCPPNIMTEFKNKQPAPMTPLPFTSEAGFEKLEISKVLKPTQSTYNFEKYSATFTLTVDSAARNKLYKMPTGTPIYNVRWSTNAMVTKA